MRKPPRAANEVRESEARLLNAQRIAKMGDWELDIVHDKLRWSDQMFEIFGIDKTQFGDSFEAFLQRVHPQDQTRMKAAQQAAVAGAAPLDIEHRIILPDGTIKMVHERGELTCDSHGRPVHLAGIVLDITERQHTAEAILQAKQRLQVLSTRMLDIQETERRQFAHELHDEIGQSLTAIKIGLQSLHRRLHDDEARKRL
ncbi:MAG: PAS domain-containing protein, partial [Prolixibacteraceae bacterium]|nr:PAS domain-containing protein [Burkholderiales bacterium]